MSGIKLLGYAGQVSVGARDPLFRAILAELAAIRDLLGPRITTMTGAATGADLVFLRACVTLRIPAIVFEPPAEVFSDPEESKLARDLTGVALARYAAPAGDVAGHLLDWADALLIARGQADGCGIATGARDLGIPSRILHTEDFSASWDIAADAGRKPRHGFGTRADLLDFLDARFAQKP